MIHTHSKHCVMVTLLYPGNEFRITHQEMIKGLKKCTAGVNYRWVVSVILLYPGWVSKSFFTLPVEGAIKSLLCAPLGGGVKVLFLHPQGRIPKVLFCAPKRGGGGGALKVS